MNNLMIFENNKIEIVELNGTILFNPYHVGKCLDLTDSAVRKAVSTMNENQAIKLTNSDVNSSNIRKLNNAGELFLTESGVYKLIFKSRKPNAEKFADWVTDEVLPAIRKTGKYEAIPTLTRKTYMGKTVMTIRDLQDLSGANNGLINHCVKMSGDDWRLLEDRRMFNFNEQNNNQYPQVQSIIIFGLATALKVADMLGFNDSQIKAIFRYFEKPVQQNIHLLTDKEQQKAKPVTLQEIELATKILAIMPDSQFKENACHTLLYDVLGQPFFRKVDFLDTIQAMAKEFDGMTKGEVSATINNNVTQDVLNSLSDRGKFLFQRQLNHSISR